MNHDPIESALRRADAAETPATPPAGFGEQVRRTAAARKHRRRAVLVNVALGCALVGAGVALRPDQPPNALPVAASASAVNDDLAARLAALRAEVHAARAAVEAIQLRRQDRALRAALNEATELYDPLLEIRLQAEATAAIRLADAERAAAVGDTARAVASYERVIALFPTSQASLAARERLETARTH